ncbi:MAG: serine hydrolase [Haliscomenobacter sp.]|nr:serine hydrolase [Haliscomenobacter sp.]
MDAQSVASYGSRPRCQRQARPPWELVGMAPAAGLKSSAYDLMQLIQAQLQLIPGITQGAALQAQQGMIEARFPGWKRPTLAAYGWLVSTDEQNRAIAWMNGGTGGYRAFAGFDANRKIGVVLLSNSQGDLTELGFAIFRQLLDL